jgi:hypothetical protein
MSMFVEVNDIDKRCPVIINLDTVMEIAPIQNPAGCEITFLESDDPDFLRREKLGGGALKGRRVMRVSDSYDVFKQFVIQKVSAEDIARVNGRVSKEVKKEKAPVSDILADIPKL